MYMTSDTISYTAAETAKFVRAELKKAFPGVKFSVRSTRSRVEVDWQDGPAWEAVDAVTKRFAGATFDSMTDLKEYHTSIDEQGRKVRYADWTNCNRHISRELMGRVAAEEAEKWGITEYEVKASNYGGKYESAHVEAPWTVKVGNECFDNYVHSIARRTAA